MAEQEILVLEYPDNVRMRKEMYLNGPNHCAHEIIDNAVDEFVTGFGKCITVEYNPETQVMIITDEGRGIPVALNEKYKIPQIQLAVENLILSVDECPLLVDLTVKLCRYKNFLIAGKPVWAGNQQLRYLYCKKGKNGYNIFRK